MEQWVEDMADLAISEEQYLIRVALQSISPVQLKQLRARYGVEPREMLRQFVPCEEKKPCQPHPDPWLCGDEPPPPPLLARASPQAAAAAAAAAALCTQHKSCVARGGGCMHRYPAAPRSWSTRCGARVGRRR